MYVNVVVQVVFVATANQLQNMSGPLLDRLEIIQLAGYTLEEKRHIAEVSACSDLLSIRVMMPSVPALKQLVTALTVMH